MQVAKFDCCHPRLQHSQIKPRFSLIIKARKPLKHEGLERTHEACSQLERRPEPNRTKPALKWKRFLDFSNRTKAETHELCDFIKSNRGCEDRLAVYQNYLQRTPSLVRKHSAAPAMLHFAENSTNSAENKLISRSTDRFRRESLQSAKHSPCSAEPLCHFAVPDLRKAFRRGADNSAEPYLRNSPYFRGTRLEGGSGEKNFFGEKKPTGFFPLPSTSHSRPPSSSQSRRTIAAIGADEPSRDNQRPPTAPSPSSTLTFSAPIVSSRLRQENPSPPILHNYLRFITASSQIGSISRPTEAEAEDQIGTAAMVEDVDEVGADRGEPAVLPDQR
ncbi:hypothetical protein LXL04_030776 [Taraxacum kok-saghyz]